MKGVLYYVNFTTFFHDYFVKSAVSKIKYLYGYAYLDPSDWKTCKNSCAGSKSSPDTTERVCEQFVCGIHASRGTTWNGEDAR